MELVYKISTDTSASRGPSVTAFGILTLTGLFTSSVCAGMMLLEKFSHSRGGNQLENYNISVVNCHFIIHV